MIGLLGLLALLLAGCIPPLPPAPGQAGLPPTLSPTAGPALPTLHITTATGADVVVYVEIAKTPEEHQRGLMNRPSLPPDQGMLFDFGQEVQESFWMHNTLIPLSIAWFTHDGVIVDIQEMAAQSDALHTPKAPYWYALEANKGFFAQHGVQIGDKVTLPK
ncbi:MAG: DUF192 domain-containing protein [Myxococcales bacterium]